MSISRRGTPRRHGREENFRAFAPDALFPLGGYPGTEDEARALFPKLDPAKTREDFVEAVQWLMKRSDSTGKVGVIGFCYGGAMANILATRVPKLAASVPFYGTSPAPEEAAKIKAPLLIHLAENDQRVNSSFPSYEEALKATKVSYQAFTYPGTQHGFTTRTDTLPPYKSSDTLPGAHLKRQATKELPMSQANNPNAAVSTERLFSANPRKVFAAFEQPERLAQWWGPSGFTNTFEQFEFKPGGRWVFVMHGPNGANYPNESVFREIQPDTRIVIEHVVKPWYRLTVTLTARGDETHLAWVQEFESPEVAAKMRRLSATANEQNLDRLQSLLASEGA